MIFWFQDMPATFTPGALRVSAGRGIPGADRILPTITPEPEVT